MSEFEISCALCGERSGHCMPAALAVRGSPDLDGRPAPTLRHTMAFWVDECPNCGYVNRPLSDESGVTEVYLRGAYRDIELGTANPLAGRLARHAWLLRETGRRGEAAMRYLYAAGRAMTRRTAMESCVSGAPR